MSALCNFFFGSTRRLLAIIAVAAACLLAFAIYLQHAVGLVPCPMCIVQRYALTAVILTAGIGALWGHRLWLGLWGALALVSAGFGAFVAARQSWMQWYPPEILTCGRDFYGIMERRIPLRDKIPALFQGTGDCVTVDWTLLGLSIANWSFIAFAAFTVALLAVAVRRGLRRGA
ncbi:disulfide bond formation protein B [Lampropedia cohaerens]|uniref:Disulfide bond formation protein B n=1 Tax=Lampropedia cohaerens TaxID=1610491 RepID=A0A0U1PX32_9BURK|nr:disulfide bond formation protein B [Lampropedia cohaerens]KKW67016.1 disulfide bond formation protein B [Lampropedia cohaerens]